MARVLVLGLLQRLQENLVRFGSAFLLHFRHEIRRHPVVRRVRWRLCLCHCLLIPIPIAIAIVTVIVIVISCIVGGTSGC